MPLLLSFSNYLCLRTYIYNTIKCKIGLLQTVTLVLTFQFIDLNCVYKLFIYRYLKVSFLILHFVVKILELLKTKFLLVRLAFLLLLLRGVWTI